MRIEFVKAHQDAVMPTRATDGSAGYDITATSKEVDKCGNVVFGTGLKVKIPKGYVGLLFPRSSISNTAHTLANAVGVIDSDFRGEMRLKFKIFYNLNRPYVNDDEYDVGERIAQMVVVKYEELEFVEVEELEDTQRGEGGFGHSGK